MARLGYYLMILLLIVSFTCIEPQGANEIQFDQNDVAEYDLSPEEVEELKRLSEDAIHSGSYQPSELDNPAEDRFFLGNSLTRRIWHWIGFDKFHQWLKNKKNKQQFSSASPVPIYIVNHISLTPDSPAMNVPGFSRPFPGTPHLQQRPMPFVPNSFHQDVAYL